MLIIISFRPSLSLLIQLFAKLSHFSDHLLLSTFISTRCFLLLICICLHSGRSVKLDRSLKWLILQLSKCRYPECLAGSMIQLQLDLFDFINRENRKNYTILEYLGQGLRDLTEKLVYNLMRFVLNVIICVFD